MQIWDYKIYLECEDGMKNLSQGSPFGITRLADALSFIKIIDTSSLFVFRVDAVGPHQ